MLALALAVGCSLAIGMIFKHAGERGLDRLALLTVNYAAASALAAALLGLGAGAAGGGAASGLSLAPGLVALGVGTGALFIFGFFMLSLATETTGMSLAIGTMRISVVIPFLASWAVWGEVPSAAQGAGLAVAAAAFFMIARREEEAAAARPAPEREAASTGRAFAVLALLFLAGGAVDVLMKAFDEAYAEANSRAFFLLLIFGVAFGIGGALVLWRGVRRGVWPRPAAYAWGAALGVVNYGSVEFILRAIRQLSGPFVFPANNIAIVIGAAGLGVWVWGERLSRLNKAGLALAALALALLSVGR